MDENDQQHVDTSTTSSMAPIPLPQLEIMYFNRCKNLRCILLCPNLEDLKLISFNKELQIITRSQKLGDDNFATPSSSSYYVSKLRKVRVSNVAWLNSFPMEALQCLVNVRIYDDSEVESLGEAGVFFCSCSSSVKSLSIEYSSKLKSVWCGGLEHLTTLDDLTILCCDDLSGEEAEERVDDNGMPCPSLPHCLRKLNLRFLRNLVHPIRKMHSCYLHHNKTLCQIN